MDPYTEDGVAATVVSIDHVRPSLRAGGGAGGVKGSLVAGARTAMFIDPHTPISTTTRGGIIFPDLHGKRVVGVDKIDREVHGARTS